MLLSTFAFNFNLRRYDAGEIAVREMLADLTSEALGRRGLLRSARHVMG